MNDKGLVFGRARGGAPMAKIETYKNFWSSGCYNVNLLVAFDDAITDGVHLISLSYGSDAPQGYYFNDDIFMRSFHDVSMGYLWFPQLEMKEPTSSATNLAPLMITITTSSTDKDFTSDIILGNIV
ncbi:hypothetical protein FXO38_30089 [Capsicum annuum]|uniref:Peptidase S8/S53 domain-containing protein n=1 Tax=Capsicum annuum TaxID=4072 RepID=A0A2G2ZNL5_CAPAN|nr:hypothetical protein FXO38_30089 [Capsicum annuum]KAF3644516.1 hypothetical protein FXO37_21418 [Capsicum annuum]PHT83535.1 hypothetical protein T459_11978 [Capsicum annuum]